jgi:hypothetical protein
MIDIDFMDPQDLVKKKGFRSRKPDAMTVAERQRKYRLKEGGRTFNATFPPEVGAGVIYLRKEWGMSSDREVVEAAIRFLTICTRQGLTRLPQSIDD